MTRVPPHLISSLVREALAEDIGPGDVTTEAIVPEDLLARGSIEARMPLVLSGLALALESFRQLDSAVSVLASAVDGDLLEGGEAVLVLKGRARALLTAERTALNFLARLSGVATWTRRCVEASRPHRAAVSDTRKTTPTLRLLEKEAVLCGGGSNHRLGLWDAVLVKDNHSDLAGGVGPAVTRAREALRGRLHVEAEVRTLEELEEALRAGADAVLLDNFSVDDLGEAVRRARGRALIEVSGGVTPKTLPAIAALGVDRISIGALTHSAPAADLTMRIEPWKK